MSWKKNACSYLLWLIYTAAVSLGMIGFLGVTFLSGGYPEEYCFPVVGVFYLIAGLLVLALHKLTQKRELDSMAANNIAWTVVEGLLLVALLGVGIFLRAGQMNYVTGSELDISQSTAFYEAAQVKEGYVIPQVVHGATYVYLELLHVVFLFFGNKIYAAVWLQVALQCLAGIFLYYAVRKLAGRIPALVTLGFLMLSPYMINKAMVLSPEILFLTIDALVLWAIAGTLKKSHCNPVLYVLVGVLIGVCSYFDLTGVVLLVFAAGVFTVEREKAARSCNKRWAAFLWNVLGAIVGWGAAILLDAVLCGKEIFKVMTAWLQQYQPGSFMVPSQAYEVSAYGPYAMVVNAFVLYGLLAFGIFSFWCRRKWERQGIWVAAAIVLMAFQYFQMLNPALMGVTYFYLFLAVLAGISIADIFALDPIKIMDEAAVDNVLANIVAQETLEEKNENLAVENPDVGKEPVSNEIHNKENEVKTPEIENEEIVEFLDDDIESGPYFDKLEEKLAEPVAKAPKKVQFLENPLPLPKKHEAKVMDFKITNVPDSDFDYEVSADDDFDI